MVFKNVKKVTEIYFLELFQKKLLEDMVELKCYLYNTLINSNIVSVNIITIMEIL